MLRSKRNGDGGCWQDSRGLSEGVSRIRVVAVVSSFSHWGNCSVLTRPFAMAGVNGRGWMMAEKNLETRTPL